MHFLESYALNSGLKIDKPFLLEKFFPIDQKEYISFYPYDFADSRRYDYWTEFMRIAYPIFQKNKISVLQIGKSNDKLVEGCIDLRGQLSVNQSQYVIRHSLMHLATNGFTVHLSSSIGKETVALFAESPTEVCAPYHREDGKFVALESDLKEQKHSYSTNEIPKSINTIKPEDIAQKVFDSLDIKFKYGFKTLYVGNRYAKSQIEYIPSQTMEVDNLNIDSLIVRMDLKFDERRLSDQLMVGPCSIITNKPVNIALLNHYKSRIPQFVYMLDENHDKKYVQSLFDEGIQCILLSEAKGEDLDQLKLEYLDYGTIHEERRGKKSDLKELKGKSLENIYYKSSRYFIHEGKIYLNFASMKKGITVDSIGTHPPQKVIDNKDFWRDYDYYLLLEKE